MPRITNDAGLELIKRFEGCRLQAYQDVAGIWTIGYGHTGGVTEGMTITQHQADLFLRNDLLATENAVVAAIMQAATAENQFGAMVALAYNIGAGAFKSSTVLRQHLAGNTAAAADAFLLWDKATIDGKLQVVQGLSNRRHAERSLYLT
ncbi:MAG TPA: lysozyme [Acetobacteraceae bacterium]|nr:lysozyme [Acetobacteraceae bacterium]